MNICFSPGLTPIGSLNTQVAIVVQGLKNYVLVDDKAFPGLALSVTSEDGIAIFDKADLFADTEGYPEIDASVLRGSVTVGDPMQTGETYKVKMRVWDKNQTENKVTIEVDIEVL